MNRPTLFAKMRAKRELLQAIRERADVRAAGALTFLTPREIRAKINAVEEQFTREWHQTTPTQLERIARAPRPYEEPPRRRWFSFGSAR